MNLAGIERGTCLGGDVKGVSAGNHQLPRQVSGVGQLGADLCLAAEARIDFPLPGFGETELGQGCVDYGLPSR